jgi:Bacterial SH3 domain
LEDESGADGWSIGDRGKLAMKNKLLLTLWLAGGVLYAISTVFLANAVLGGIGGGHAGDKEKPTATTATDAQCQQASAEARDTRPAETAAVTPEQPTPSPDAARAKEDAANRESAPLPATEADGQATGQAPSPEPLAGEEQASPPQASQQQDAPTSEPGQDAEVEEWAHVVAGTADIRSEPSVEAPLIYALPAGWQVRVISRASGWVQIQEANSGAAGWVDASALAPGTGPGGGQPGYGAYGPRYGAPGRYAEEGYPDGPSWPPRRREPGGQFTDFLRRALGSF